MRCRERIADGLNEIFSDPIGFPKTVPTFLVKVMVRRKIRKGFGIGRDGQRHSSRSLEMSSIPDPSEAEKIHDVSFPARSVID
jgi:hypothetical protein